ncbi:MAG: YceI family protein [Myxococcota bacterium]|nr:YceI family protein [Myxococcota bacterium]
MLALAGCSGAFSPMADEAASPVNARHDPSRVVVPLDPAQIRVEARVRALTAHTLSIPVMHGTWSAPRGRLDRSLIELTFELGGATSEPQFVADIAKSPHFLDTATFPEGRLEAQWLRPNTDEGSNGYDLFFDLELKNRRRHLLAPAELSRVGCEARLTTAFSIDRREFGISHPGRYDSIVGDRIEVSVEVSAPTAPFGVPCAPQSGDLAQRNPATAILKLPG